MFFDWCFDIDAESLNFSSKARVLVFAPCIAEGVIQHLDHGSNVSWHLENEFFGFLHLGGRSVWSWWSSLFGPGCVLLTELVPVFCFGYQYEC